MSNRNIEYHITKKGIERRKLLNIQYLKASYNIYISARENISLFLNQIIDRGYKDILLYGAGEVAELLLQVINLDLNIPISVLAVIDDNPNKQNTFLLNHKIKSKEIIHNLKYDGILISSYSQRENIYENLISIGYKKDNILMFFEL